MIYFWNKSDTGFLKIPKGSEYHLAKKRGKLYLLILGNGSLTCDSLSLFCTCFQWALQSTLPKSNPMGLKKKLWLRENSTYVGSNTIECIEKKPCLGLWLRWLFNLCEFDLGRVNCIPTWHFGAVIMVIIINCILIYVLA